jgi:hypothetical protein
LSGARLAQQNAGYVGDRLSSGNLPAHLRAFVASYIRTVVELETLLLLYNQPQRKWRAADLGKELRIDEQYAQQEIADLTQRGFAQCEGNQGCYYAPRTPELHQAVGELAELYAQRRVSVIEAIYSRPADPIQSFADAFRLRKGRPND